MVVAFAMIVFFVDVVLEVRFSCCYCRSSGSDSGSA